MNRLDIISYKKYIVSLTVLSVFIALISLVFIPFNKSIEFTGGFIFETQGIVSDQEISNLIGEKFTTYKTGGNTVIKVHHLENHTFESLQSILSQSYTVTNSSMVSPSITSSLVKKSLLALFFSVSTVFIYLFLRFNVYYSIGSICTIMHDVVLSLAFIKMMQIELCITTVAAILTIIGYSVNDTVIIYDKIRAHLTVKSKLSETINYAVSETLPRTIGTSFTTVLSILPVALLTSGQIHDFSTIVIFGIVIGTISSIAVSALSLLPFENKIHKLLELKKELAKSIV